VDDRDIPVEGLVRIDAVKPSEGVVRVVAVTLGVAEGNIVGLTKGVPVAEYEELGERTPEGDGL